MFLLHNKQTLYSQQLICLSHWISVRCTYHKIRGGFQKYNKNNTGVRLQYYNHCFAFPRPSEIFYLIVRIDFLTLMVFSGFHSTGMFMHPPKASAITIGCGNVPITTHLIVYWLAPLLGAWLSCRLQKTHRIVEIDDSSQKGSKNDQRHICFSKTYIL